MAAVTLAVAIIALVIAFIALAIAWDASVEARNPRNKSGDRH